MRELAIALEAVLWPLAAVACLGVALHAMMVHGPGWEIRGAAGIAGFLAVWALGLVRGYPRNPAPLHPYYEL